ncbi:LOW QUALITY PROTEIN: protein NRT1/ PTR FAMILY 5.10 [Ziziphus jujuba]|uniref:LOW QUALITY PROTEIN: protein NRT1/ PTR FAMILY 5.10 n=1 Tax=Ziziphus jujuba TaxID=326968 RepID=A0ABM4A9D5_ZIZJJ|nr:LOW QUALITY PROTEIN: protein NRT1/ PTR FAMILY 5.10 [Ziziphus jujuba]
MCMASDTQTPLLDDIVDGVVDNKGRPVLRSSSGGWRSAGFILAVEVAERFAYYGISSNLISYLTGPLGQSAATAAENVNVWSGTALLLPLLGAFVADSFFGQYCTIVVASLLYILGLGLLTLSAFPTSASASHQNNSPPQLQCISFLFSLYLVAIAQGGHKPCIQAFGADQFDGQHPEECKAKSSFFNWWYFSTCMGIFSTNLIVSYIQDNLSWSLGFGVPCIAMVFALLAFLLGTKTYRYRNIIQDKKSPFVRIGRVFIAALRNWRSTSPSSVETEEDSHQQSFKQFKFLNKALLVPADALEAEEKIDCSMEEVEEAKAVLRLVPIWGTCLVYAIVFAQSSTFLTKQAATMNRTIKPGFDIPAASVQSFKNLASVLFVPIYDRFVIPVAKVLTRKPFGFTMLQRIGIGMALSALYMALEAVVEIKRLKTAEEYDLLDMPNAPVPMSVWWLVLLYLLFGISEVFTVVGQQEFFYDQVPNELRSIGLALYLSIYGVGSFLSSFLISIIDKATSESGQESWFASNLNRGHLDYFYWLLSVLSLIGFVVFLFFTKSYIYKV